MFDKDYILDFSKRLFETASPSGYCDNAIDFLGNELEKIGYQSSKNQKGNLLVYVKGKSSSNTRAISTHVDTLGLMVRSIKSNGYLAVTALGGPLLNTYNGEYCQIITRDGQVYTGTILSTSPSIHVYPDARNKNIDDSSLEIRIDADVKSKEDVLKLGINNGDIVAVDPKFTIAKDDYIKSRFLDDKISVALVMGLLKYLKENSIELISNTYFIFTTYEEVGHGSSSTPSDIEEMLAVDMGCIGLDLSCTEFDVSICAKDGSGPYDYNMTSKLISLAKDNNLNYVVDIYPFYSSDASAALRGGNNIRGALIGPGVHASHGMERTNYIALVNTMSLLLKYLQQ